MGAPDFPIALNHIGDETKLTVAKNSEYLMPRKVLSSSLELEAPLVLVELGEEDDCTN